METKDRMVPMWAVDYIAEWKSKLLLHEWGTLTTITESPAEDDSGETRACVTLFPDVRVAKIEIRDDIPESLDNVEKSEADQWKQTIIHELFHIRIGLITEMIDRDILLTQFGTHLYPTFYRMLEREVEPVVEIMAHVLFTLSEAQNDR